MEMKEERLKHIYKNWRTEDLVNAVTVDRANYEPLTIEVHPGIQWVTG